MSDTNDLDRQLKALQRRYAGSRSPAASRDRLMARFDSLPPKRVRNQWIWTLPVAAALLLGVILARHPQPGGPVAMRAEEPAYVTTYVGTSDPQDEGFIAVPYVPPLATGELVRVVHRELYPSALASLGINVDPSLNSGIAADLLMGEDGFPRAVRVSNEF